MSERRAIVTGSSGGIGSAVVDRLLREGWTVDGWDVVAPSREHGDGFHHREVDLASVEATQAAARAASARPLGAFVHVAGVSRPTPLKHSDPALARRILDVNLLAPHVALDILCPALRAASPSAVVLVSSVHAATTVPGMSIYAASKAGIEALARGLAVELHADGIVVNALAPGAVETPMLAQGAQERGPTVPKAFVSQPEEVARMVSHLVDPALPRGVTGGVLRIDHAATAWLATEFAPEGGA